MLGVDPDAGIDEIRSRYRALARELHPDHRSQTPRPGSAEDDAEMAAVNLAWHVLGDPERRAAYDRLRDPASAGPSPSSSGGRFGPANPPPVHEHATAPGCAVAAAGSLPWVAVLMVLAAIFVFTAYAGSGGDPTDDPGEPAGNTAEPVTAVRDLRGMCIQQVRGTIVPVDCFTVPNEGVIVAQASIGAACPDGTVEWVVRQQNVLACTESGSEVRATP